MIGLNPQTFNRGTEFLHCGLLANSGFHTLLLMASIPMRGVECLFKHGASFMLLNIQIKFGSGSASDFFFWLIYNFPLLTTQQEPTNRKKNHPHVFSKLCHIILKFQLNFRYLSYTWILSQKLLNRQVCWYVLLKAAYFGPTQTTPKE